ncbi:MAG: hypothetical protein AB2708_00580, partial [Candidatus Thiodiazotropha taylori]
YPVMQQDRYELASALISNQDITVIIKEIHVLKHLILGHSHYVIKQQPRLNIIKGIYPQMKMGQLIYDQHVHMPKL